MADEFSLPTNMTQEIIDMHNAAINAEITGNPHYAAALRRLIAALLNSK